LSCIEGTVRKEKNRNASGLEEAGGQADRGDGELTKHCPYRHIVSDFQHQLAIAVPILNDVSRFQRAGIIEFLSLLNERIQTFDIHPRRLLLDLSIKYLDLQGISLKQWSFMTRRRPKDDFAGRQEAAESREKVMGCLRIYVLFQNKDVCNKLRGARSKAVKED
jgi:hypothetical protein